MLFNVINCLVFQVKPYWVLKLKRERERDRHILSWHLLELQPCASSAMCHQFMNWWHTTDVMGGMAQMAAWLATSQYVQKIMECMQGFSFPWSLCKIHDKTLHLIRVSLRSSAWEFENMGSGQFGTISVCQRGTRDKRKNSTSSLVEEADAKTVHYTRI